MTVAFSRGLAADAFGSMERTGSFPEPHRSQHNAQHMPPPPGSSDFEPGYGQQFVYYYGAPPRHMGQPPSGFMPHQPPPMSFQPAMRPFPQPGFQPPMWYGPPAAYADLGQRPMMRPPGMMPGGMHIPPQMPGTMPPPGMMPPGGMYPQPQAQAPQQAERPLPPRQQFLIPGNGVRSNSTSSVKRVSSSSVRSLSEDLGERPAASSAAPPALAPPPQRDVSNAHAPCAFFLKTGICAYGDRCKFQHATPGMSMAMLNSLGLPLRPGQPECQFYSKHMRCGFGASCKYHHPEPQGRPWPMSGHPPYPMYPHPQMMMPMLPPMPLTQAMMGPDARGSGMSETSTTVGGTSVRTASSSSILDEQYPPNQRGSTRRRSRLSQGRGGDGGLPLPQPPLQAAPPLLAAPMPVVLPAGDDDIIVHESVEQPIIFELQAPAEQLPVSVVAQPQGLPAAVGSALLPQMLPPEAAPQAVAETAPAESQPEAPQQVASILGGGQPAEAAAAAPSGSPAAASEGAAAITPAAAGLDTAAAAEADTPSSPKTKTSTPPAPQPAQQASEPAAAAAAGDETATSPAATAVDAAVLATAEELDRLEVESSDGSYCSAESQQR